MEWKTIGEALLGFVTSPYFYVPFCTVVIVPSVDAFVKWTKNDLDNALWKKGKQKLLEWLSTRKATAEK